MKDSSLAVSLGLAAIDGLTCAFIAILILALILIGPGSSPSANDADTSQVLMVHIAADSEPSRALNLRLLVDWWKDCQTMSQSECFAEMFVTKVKPGGAIWHVRLRVADAGDSFTAGTLSYKLWLKVGSSPSVENLILNPDQPLVACVNWSAKTVQAPCP